jgi:DNA-binding IclR family transcriptional regulator
LYTRDKKNNKGDGEKVIQSLDRGLLLLSLLAENNCMSVTEIANELSVNKSTVTRLIQTLKHHDLVQLDKATNKYKLGYRILYYSEALLNNLNVITLSRPVLSRLSAEVSESVHLAMFNKNLVYVVDQVKSNRVYSLSATVGMIEPLHCSSVGKCILAFRKPEFVRSVFENYIFTKYTENTITSLEDLLIEFEKIRNNGYAVDEEELTPGVRCVAVPIYDYRGTVKYCIGISGPSVNFTDKKVMHYIKKMVEASNEIGKEIGSRVRSKIREVPEKHT